MNGTPSARSVSATTSLPKAGAPAATAAGRSIAAGLRGPVALVTPVPSAAESG